MTAAGKITTARIETGDRVLVKHYTREEAAAHTTLDYLGKDWALGISTTKTGQGVEVARVLKVEAATVTGGRRDKRVYDVYTTAGVISNCAPSQTWTLAPEDAAGVKRAHVEALALNEVMDAYPVAEEAPEAPAAEVAEDETPAPIILDEAQEEFLEVAFSTVPRQAGKTTAAEARTKAEPAAPAEDWREPAVRTRFHGKSLGERRQARKNQKAARRRTRAKNR